MDKNQQQHEQGVTRLFSQAPATGNQRNRNIPFQQPKAQSDFDQVVISTRRVAKVTKGRKRLRFTAVVAIGNKQGRVGIGIGRGGDPKLAIEKGGRNAKKNLISVVISKTTIPHNIDMKFKGAKIRLKPAKEGSGIIAGSCVRIIAELAGIKDLRGKILGSPNKTANAYAMINALSLLRDKRI